MSVGPEYARHGDDHDRVWRRLPDAHEDMGWQLAHTDALFAGLEAGAPPSLRWYVPAQTALVLGRSQGIQRADVDAANRAGIAVYGRTSGGGAVLVERDALSMDVALPAGHPLLTRDVTLSYQWIGEVWADALRALGIVGARAIPTEEVRAIPALTSDDPLRLACYGTLSPWEVVVDGRKVVGLSQIRRRAGGVYPIGVHLSWHPERLVELLALDAKSRRELVEALYGRVAALDELVGQHLVASAVIAAVEAALAARLGVRLVAGDWLAVERDTAERLEGEYFRPLA